MVRRLTFAGLLGCLVVALATAQQPGALPQKSPPASGRKSDLHTRVSLLADVGSIQPGVRFTVGVRLRMDEGWHTYWKNPGEAGLPTQVEWTLPPGFVAGEIQWPLPNKFSENGDVVTYGYKDSTTLLVPVTAPPMLSPGKSLTFQAKVRWLECERICVPGSAIARLSLPVGQSGTPSNFSALISTYRSLVPAVLSLPQGVTVSSTAKSGSVNFALTTSTDDLVISKDLVPDFYPEGLGDIVLGRTQVKGGANGATLVIPLSAYQPVAGPLEFRGVFVYQLRGGERRAGTVSVLLSREFCASIPVAGEKSPQNQQGESSGSLLDSQFSTNGVIGVQQPFILFIVYAIAGGLLLNIMPCVLPVIGLKVFGLVRMAGDHPRKVKMLGLFFSLGILASFLALAVVVIILKTAGEQVGWGFQFQEPLFVIVMCAIVFAFGLSLFGVYEIQLPGSAVARVGSVVERERNGNGYLASFGEGVFATILATPCTAPILGTALGFAFAQPPGIIVIIFTSTAIGMALPYLVLTLKPAWMKFLPKPGEWMVTAKQCMGFLMMATLLWLLYVLGKQLGMEAVIWTGAFLLVVGIACWLIGRFATLTATRIRYSVIWAVSLVLILLGYFAFVGPLLEAHALITGETKTDGAGAPGPAQGIQWQPFSLPKLELILRENKTVFIDFTAEWCLTCKVNEKTVMADRRVVEKFQSSGIIPIRADWTSRNADITRLLSKFGRSGVPLYVIFPAGKPLDPIVLPEVITTGIVLDAIDRAIASPPAARLE